jgi:hypothetical protein
VNRAFVGFESNKHEVAAALAKQFPSLASRLPPKKKCWQSEDYRIGIFDAAAVGSLIFDADQLGSPPRKMKQVVEGSHRTPNLDDKREMDPFEHSLRNAQCDVPSLVAWTPLSDPKHTRSA